MTLVSFSARRTSTFAIAVILVAASLAACDTGGSRDNIPDAAPGVAPDSASTVSDALPQGETPSEAGPDDPSDPWAADEDIGSAPPAEGSDAGAGAAAPVLAPGPSVDPAAGGAGAAPEPAADRAPGEAAPMPLSAVFTRLTEPGCCTQPAWSADGRQVYFVDRPSPDAPAGIWAAAVDRPGGAPERVADEVAYYSPGLTYRIELDATTTTLVRRADGQRWVVPAGGRSVSFSPNRNRIAWQAGQPGVPNERATARVWVADVDGGNAREVAALPRGTLSAWLTDDMLLVRGRDSLGADEEVLWALSLGDGTRREIARGERLRGETVAPGGGWVAYYIAQHRDPAANGLWIASTAGGIPRRLDAALFGAYRWRDHGRLLLVPLRADATTHELVELSAADLSTRRLTDPQATPFKIANGDWTVSPDGRRVAFVESRDRAIWVIELPAVEEAGATSG